MVRARRSIWRNITVRTKPPCSLRGKACFIQIIKTAHWIFAGKFLENGWMNAGFFHASRRGQSTV